MMEVSATNLPPAPRESSLRTAFKLTRDFVWQPLYYHERWGDTFHVRFLGDDIYVTRDPEILHDALIARHADFGKDKTTRFLERLLGNGLLTSSGELWRDQRRLLGPAFLPARVDAFATGFARTVKAELSTWKTSEPLDVGAAMSRLTLRLALSSLFGVESANLSGFEASMHAVMQYFRGIAGTGLPLPEALPSPGNLAFRRARKHLRSFALGLIEARRRSGPGDAGDLLGRLVEHERATGVSSEQLVDEVVTLLLAGHETTALALTYALLLLERHPEYAEGIREEAARIDFDREIGAEELAQLECTTRVIKESLRLYPPAWFLGREALRDTRLGSFPVRAGVQIWIFTWAIHRSARWYEAPGSFRPERWTASFERGLGKTAYLPFGAGPRICIGNRFALLEATLALSLLLRDFAFRFDSAAEPEFLPSVTLRLKRPLLARIARRR
jgi:cytochrome P450